MHDGQRLAIVGDDVLERGAHQAGGAFDRDRLDADAGGERETDLLDAHFILQELDDLLGAFGFGGPFDAGVDVLGVLAEDDHVGQFRVLQRGRHALEVLHRTDALVEIEFLTQGDVQRTDAAADRGRHRTLDRNRVFLEGVEGFGREPLVRTVDAGGFFTGINFHPVNLLGAAVGLGDGGVDHLDHDRRDVDADAVAFDEGNDRIVGYRLSRNDF